MELKRQQRDLPRLCNRPRVLQFEDRMRVPGIIEDGQAPKGRRGLTEQFGTLGTEITCNTGHASHVSTWASEARNETRCHCIASDHHDGDTACDILDVLDCPIADGEYC